MDGTPQVAVLGSASVPVRGVDSGMPTASAQLLAQAPPSWFRIAGFVDHRRTSTLPNGIVLSVLDHPLDRAGRTFDLDDRHVQGWINPTRVFNA